VRMSANSSCSAARFFIIPLYAAGSA
jgi:hypothetical protein